MKTVVKTRPDDLLPVADEEPAAEPDERAMLHTGSCTVYYRSTSSRAGETWTQGMTTRGKQHNSLTCAGTPPTGRRESVQSAIVMRPTSSIKTSAKGFLTGKKMITGLDNLLMAHDGTWLSCRGFCRTFKKLWRRWVQDCHWGLFNPNGSGSCLSMILMQRSAGALSWDWIRIVVSLQPWN